MDQKDEYTDGVRMYSDVLEVEEKAPRKNVEYFKKVEKVTSKTVIKEGSDPQSQKVVTTTIIHKDGDNPEQVTQRVIRSSNFDGNQFEQNLVVPSTSNYQSGYERISKKYEETSKRVSSSNNYTRTQNVPQLKAPSSYKNNITQKTEKKSQVVVSTNNKRSKPSATISINPNAYKRQNKQEVKGNRSYSSSQQTKKITVSETTRRRDNVVNTGYGNKNGNIIKKEKKETKVYQSYSVPKPVIVNERQSIIIQDTRKERQGEKIENYEYHETKDIKDHNKDTLVIHKRLGDPYYQIIDRSKGRYSSHTSNARGYKSRFDLDQNDIDKRVKTVITTETTTSKYRNNSEGTRNIDISKYVKKNANKYQNKTVTSTQRTSNVNANANAGNKRINTAYQKTVNIEERRRKYVPKGRFEHNLTEKNNRTTTNVKQSVSRYVNRREQSQINSTSKDRKKLPPTQKKYQEKSEESYKRGRRQYNENLSQKVYDTEKIKKEGVNKYQRSEPNQYKRITKEIVQKEYITNKYEKENEQNEQNELNEQKDKEPDEQEMRESKGDNNEQYENERKVEEYEETYEQRANEEANKMPEQQIVEEVPDKYRQQDENYYKSEQYIYEQQQHDSHQCPVHGPHGRRSQGHHMKGIKEENTYDYQYTQMNENQNANNRFNRFGNIEEVDNYQFYESKHVTEKVNNSLKNQNILRNEKEYLSNNQLYEQDNRSRMTQGVQMGQLEQIKQVDQSDYSKLYIATRVIPVYSEMINQYRSYNINHVCNICGSPLGQTQFFSQQQSMVNTCPMHGQRIVYQQYSGY